MSSIKTTFSCGHCGKGSFCHRCKDAERFEALATVPGPKKTKPMTEEARQALAKHEAAQKHAEFEAAALRSVLPRAKFKAEWDRKNQVTVPATRNQDTGIEP